VLQLATITAPFYASLAELGEFELVQAGELPEDYQTLLAHDDHMTVTVEAFHGSMVDVQVLQERREGDVYTRASLLVRQSDRAVVQFGIMRINLTGLSDVVRREIEQRGTPLGRILIRHNVMRHVRLFKLWRIWPGPELVRHLTRTSLSEAGETVGWDEVPPVAGSSLGSGGTSSQPTTKQCIYGRSAGIVVEGRPSVELLEIVKA
jgi:chorismate-pyruvate lyase